MAGKQHHVGQPRVYATAEDFRAAVEDYFDSITRQAPVTEWVPSELKPNGRQVLEERPVLGPDGKPMYKTVYISPPNVASLCVHLHMSEDTWNRYAQDSATYQGYQEIARDAKLRMQAYNVEELLTREKNVQGLMFNLKNNYGWKDSKELELGQETRKTISLDHMTMAEKLALIRQAADDTDDGDAGGD